MIEPTRRAIDELRRLRAEQDGATAQSLRLLLTSEGDVSLTFDSPEPMDAIIEDSGGPLLVTDHETAQQLSGIVLHFRTTGDSWYGAPGFVLLARRSGERRIDVLPVQTQRRTAA